MLMKVILMLLLLQTDLQAQESPFRVTHGNLVHYENFESEFIPARNIEVWLPPGYDPELKYPVLYMHDGQMLFDGDKTWNKQEWKIDETLGNLIINGEITPVIVVGIWNIPEARHSEYFPQKPFESLPLTFRDSLIHKVNRNKETDLFSTAVYSDRYLRFITSELKPFIDETYPTLSDRDHTMIAGSSMGGLISMYAICEYPEIFGGAACLSTHWPGLFQLEGNPIPDAFLVYLESHIPNPGNHYFYFDHGTETLDRLYGETQDKVDLIFDQKGYSKKNYMSLEFENQDHSENAWQSRMHIPLQFLIEHTVEER